MPVSMSDFDLEPETDFTIDENAVRFFHYWEALSMELIMHLIEHHETIPASTTLHRVMFEFCLSDEAVNDIFHRGESIVHGDLTEREEEHAEVDEELINDLIEFVGKRIAQRAEEEAAFKGMMGAD